MNTNNKHNLSDEEFEKNLKLEFDEKMWIDFNKFQVHILQIWSKEYPILKISCVFKGNTSNKYAFMKKFNFKNEILILIEKSEEKLKIKFSKKCKQHCPPELIYILKLYIETRVKTSPRTSPFSDN